MPLTQEMINDTTQPLGSETDRTLSELLDIYRYGGALSDVELVRLRQAMQALASAAYPFGDLFRLTAQHANIIALNCLEFERNRNREE